MQTALISVTGIYPPDAGKKKARVRVDGGEYYYVWPDQLDKLAQGASYQIDYTADDFKGKTYKTIKAIRPADGGMPASDDLGAGKSAQQPAHHNSPARPFPIPQVTRVSPAQGDMSRSEHIFVCGALNAAIKSGQLKWDDPQLINAINKFRSAYGATFGADEAA